MCFLLISSPCFFSKNIPCRIYIINHPSSKKYSKRSLHFACQFPTTVIPHKYLVFKCVSPPITSPCFFSKSHLVGYISSEIHVEKTLILHVSSNIFKVPLNYTRFLLPDCNTHNPNLWELFVNFLSKFITILFMIPFVPKFKDLNSEFPS